MWLRHKGISCGRGGGVNVAKYRFIYVADLTGSSFFGLDTNTVLSFNPKPKFNSLLEHRFSCGMCWNATMMFTDPVCYSTVHYCNPTVWSQTHNYFILLVLIFSPSCSFHWITLIHPEYLLQNEESIAFKSISKQ